MAKITPVSLVTAISGRTCLGDETHFMTNKRTGKVYAAKLCNPYDGSNPTEKQQQVRNAFTTLQQIVKVWRAEHAPSEAQPQGSAEFQAMMKLYKSQRKCGNWLAFLRTKVVDGAVPSFLTGASAGPVTVDGISVTSIDGKGYGALVTVTPGRAITVYGTKLTDLCGDNFESSEHVYIEFTPASDTIGTLLFSADNALSTAESTIKVTCYDKVLFMVKAKGV